MARDLDARINGPTSLKRNLQAYAAAQGGETTTRALIQGLGEEIHRIQHGMIASLAHPNTEGAASYARNATHRYAEHLQRMNRVRAGAPANTLDTLLRRYNMRGGGALAGAVPNFDVDSIALIVKTTATSSANMILPVFLVLGKVGGGVLINRLLTFQPYRRELPVAGAVILDKRYPYLDPGPDEPAHTRCGRGSAGGDRQRRPRPRAGPGRPTSPPGGKSWTPSPSSSRSTASGCTPFRFPAGLGSVPVDTSTSDGPAPRRASSHLPLSSR